MILQASSSLVIGALAVVFALGVASQIGAELGLCGTVVVLALTVMLSMKLIGFLMLTVRHEAISQILGLLVLENGIFLGAQILVPGMPLLIEIVILFDLLIVVACFGLLVQYLMTHVGTHQQPATPAAGGLDGRRPSPSRSCWRPRWRSCSSPCCATVRGVGAG